MYYVSKQHFSNIFAFSSVTLLNPKVQVWLSNVERVSTVEDDLHCSEEGTACSPSAAICSTDGIGIQHLSCVRAERDPKISKSVLRRLPRIVRPQVVDLSIPIGYPGAKTWQDLVLSIHIANPGAYD